VSPLLTPQQVATYLDRLELERPPVANAESLRQLHIAHLHCIPFECIDVWRDVPLSLEIADLFDKVFRRRRGGFCYELNWLFSRLLVALGYEVDLLAAQVMDQNGILGPPFDHMALRVRCKGEFLCDVGFGRSFSHPLPLANAAVSDPTGSYRLVGDGPDHQWLEHEPSSPNWKQLYRVDLRPRELGEFDGMLAYHQESPASPFPRTFIATIATKDGRRTVRDMECIETALGTRRCFTFACDSERENYILTHMGIDMKGEGPS
jgi:N-hydroxyarylamine O-acetyltransferase